jgi:hypothetical protein
MSTINEASALITLLLQLGAAAGRVSALVGTMNAEGRTVLTDAERAEAVAADDLARAGLLGAIEAAKAGG